MLKSTKQFFLNLLDLVLPRRKDSVIISELNEKGLENLPKANEVENLSWIHPLWNYRDNRVRAIVWELKYKENTLLLEKIGKFLYDEILDLVSNAILWDKDSEFILMPLPISKERRIERGYNQSEYIAKAILENDLSRTLLYAPQWFEKVKETPRQSMSESKEVRMKNLTGCFEASPRVMGKYVIIIDDVVTTGSTLLEARKALLSAGARGVFTFTIAH